MKQLLKLNRFDVNPACFVAEFKLKHRKHDEVVNRSQGGDYNFYIILYLEIINKDVSLISEYFQILKQISNYFKTVTAQELKNESGTNAFIHVL